MQATSHPLLWNLLKTAGAAGAVAAQAQLKRPAVGFLWDHSVQGRAILPGAAMFEMTMAFGKVSLLNIWTDALRVHLESMLQCPTGRFTRCTGVHRGQAELECRSFMVWRQSKIRWR